MIKETKNEDQMDSHEAILELVQSRGWKILEQNITKLIEDYKEEIVELDPEDPKERLALKERQWYIVHFSSFISAPGEFIEDFRRKKKDIDSD